MASSKKLPKNSLAEKKSALFHNDLKRFLKHFFRQHQLARPTLLVAYSGGLDSTVLLHALRHVQNELPFHLRAMHIHHGLSPHADDWAKFCENIAISLDVPIEIVHVSVDTDSGLGVEATARHARYDALNAAPADFICLGHHQDDQAETILLQLARGAGVKGLAGMAQIDFKRRLIRPLLNTKRVDLKKYAERHQLQWIEDESNDDVKYDRNFMRHTLIPVFNERYADITKTLARSALHMGEASEMLDDLAALDAGQVLDQQKKFGALVLDALHLLSRARQGNLIRWWLAENHITMPSSALLQQIVEQLKSTKADAAIKIKVSDCLSIMRYKQRAYLVEEAKPSPHMNLLWQGEDMLTLPDMSRLFFSKKLGEGFAYQRSNHIKLRIKNREGGEKFKPALGRPRRSLKTVLQESEIPPWQRQQLPLIFMDEVLVVIPNIGVDADMQAMSDEIGLSIRWEPATE